MKNIGKTLGWGLVFILAAVVALLSARFLFQDFKVASPDFGPKFERHSIAFFTHIIGGMIALLVGPVQFLKSLRIRYPIVHRFLGRVYMLGVLAGGLAGLYLATISLGGLPTHFGFGALAVLWLASAFMAFNCVRQGDIQSHRRWMIRNYALTFAAVTLRLELPLLILAGLKFEKAFILVSWLSWLPNLLVVEAYLQRRRESKNKIADDRRRESGGRLQITNRQSAIGDRQ
jgi:uncharacterized membrane protein